MRRRGKHRILEDIRSLLATLLVVGAGCSQSGLLSDGTSVSFGPARRGTILHPAGLPIEGVGYRIPPTWEARGLRYGTDELVSVIVYVGRELERQRAGAVLSVADLSLLRGGPSPWHRSHQTGRDVDLLFLTRDAAGNPIAADVMRRFGADGAARGAERIYFDDEANWLLIKALLDNPIAEVQYAFISDDLKQRVLDHAIAQGESAELVQRAAWILHQPGDSLPHDDHMHVRIFCPQTDLGAGCSDEGVLRWHKRDYKYQRRVERNARRLARQVLDASGGALPIGAVAIFTL